MLAQNLITRLGKGIFGRGARLAVGVWALRAEGGVFSQHEVVMGVALPQSNVREELDRLVGLGLLVDVPRGDGPGKRYYARVDDHPAWRIFAAAEEAAVAIAESESERTTDPPTRTE